MARPPRRRRGAATEEAVAQSDAAAAADLRFKELRAAVEEWTEDTNSRGDEPADGERGRDAGQGPALR